MYIVLSGTQPWLGEFEDESQLVFEGDVWMSKSTEVQDVIRGMLRADPANRMSSQEVMTHLIISAERWHILVVTVLSGPVSLRVPLCCIQTEPQLVFAATKLAPSHLVCMV